MERGKTRSSNTVEQTLGNSFDKTLGSSASTKGNPRYSLNLKLKDLSFRVPWAIESQQSNNQFRTTYNTYGYTYK